MTYVKITDKNGKPIDLSNPLPVTGGGTDGSSVVFSGTATISDTASALPDLAIGEAIIQNDADSATDLYVGSASAQNWRLKPGEWISARITNLNLIASENRKEVTQCRKYQN